VFETGVAVVGRVRIAGFVMVRLLVAEVVVIQVTSLVTDFESEIAPIHCWKIERSSSDRCVTLETIYCNLVLRASVLVADSAAF
jgi:hypothetical protein